MALRRFNRDMVRHDPFGNFFNDSFFTGEMERGPAANIRTMEDQYEVHLALPGYKKDHLHISVENNVLTIRGDEVKESEVTDTYSRREFYQSQFERSFSLPDDVNEEKISAQFEDGVLRVKIGRHDHDPKQRTRAIQIS